MKEKVKELLYTDGVIIVKENQVAGMKFVTVIVVEDDIAVEKEVKTGIDTGEFVEIISGLEFDEKIIIEGQFYVSDGSKVKVVRGE